MSAEGFRLFGPGTGYGQRRGALVLLQDPRGRLLLHLRDTGPDVSHGGLWSLFGGGVEPGETLVQAAVRELQEEIGVAFGADALTPFAWVVSDGPRRGRLYVFTADIDVAPSALRLGEGAGFGFFTPDQVAQLGMPAVLKPVIAAYLSTKT